MGKNAKLVKALEDKTCLKELVKVTFLIGFMPDKLSFEQTAGTFCGDQVLLAWHKY